MEAMAQATAPAGRRLRVFLCHASGDKPAVRDLCARLRREGFAPWLDEEDLLPGQRWQEEIPKAVRAADVVLICLSNRSVNKEGYVQKEIKFALDVAEEKPEGIIYLIPLRLEDCAVPERLSAWQWVDLFASNGYTRLAEALRARERSIRPVVPPDPTTKRQKREVDPKDGLEYVWIPPGEFLMGATPDDLDALDAEKPRHAVRIGNGFWLCSTPITVACYLRFAEASGRPMPDAPEFNPGWRSRDHPMVNVTWQEAQSYAGWAGGGLPSEAEWEYAARGGKDGLKYPWGNEIGPEHANYGLHHSGTTPVTSYASQNDWGLRDMCGNVSEWVADRWDANTYAARSPKRAIPDPRGPAEGPARVLRGGSWHDPAASLRVSARSWAYPGQRYVATGFRLVRDVFVP